MARRRACIALAGVLGLLISACGGGADRATSKPDAATTDAPPDVEQYLLQDHEVPGLEAVSSPQTDSGEPFALTEDGAEQLRRSGYI